MENIPAWANSVLESLSHSALFPSVEDECLVRGYVKFVADRWNELETAVVPHLIALTDEQKQTVLAIALGRGCDDYEAAATDLRGKHNSLREVEGKIAVHAAALAELIRRRQRILDGGGVDNYMPTLLDLIRSAGEKYPEWDFASDQKIAAFMPWTGPGLEDILDSLVSGYDVKTLSHPVDSPLNSRSGIVRALLDDFFLADLPDNFSLPDSALAALVGVAFNMPPGEPNVDTVKSARQRHLPRPLATGHFD